MYYVHTAYYGLLVHIFSRCASELTYSCVNVLFGFKLLCQPLYEQWCLHHWAFFPPNVTVSVNFFKVPRSITVSLYHKAPEKILNPVFSAGDCLNWGPSANLKSQIWWLKDSQKYLIILISSFFFNIEMCLQDKVGEGRERPCVIQCSLCHISF